jgi:broad specificity phosphatase PhoE
MQAMRILALAILLLPLNLAGEENLWSLLQRGGQVILIRHTITDPGVGDPPGMKLEDCATQRNLSDEGRAHARRIGEAFRKRQVPIGRVLSSPWCRCVETAKLAFGRAEVSEPLSNLFGRPENRERQMAAMKKLLLQTERNLVLVSHGSTISALTGISPGTGEMVVVKPLGAGRFEVLGRLSLE